MKLRIAFAAAGLVALAGCTHPDDTAPGFGDSVRAMIEAQALPDDGSTAAPEGSGAVGAGAQARYKTGQTRPLMPAATSSANIN